VFKASDVVKYLNEIIEEQGDYQVVIVVNKDVTGINVSPLASIGYTIEGGLLTLTSYATEMAAGGAAPLAALGANATIN